VSFFDDLERAAPPPPSYRTPEWLAPPDNVLPATVALDVLLVHRPDVAVWVADALVFPSGLAFGLSVQRRESSDDPPPFFGPPDPDGLRFGLQLADSRKVVVQQLAACRPLLQRPDQPILRPRSGGGGGTRSRVELWLWPLPPPGRLAFVCAWPAEGVDETRAEIDAAPIVAASARAVELWPEERPLPPDHGDVVI
jgi:hypothetical protein